MSMLHKVNNKVHWDNFEVYTDHEYSLHDHPEESLYENMVEAIFMLFCYACSKHQSVRFIRFDLKFSKNEHYLDCMIRFGSFLSYFIKWCSRLEGKTVVPYYLWCKEKESGLNPHFHLFLLICDRKEKEYTSILKKAQAILQAGNHRQFEATGNFCQTDLFGNRQENGIVMKQNGILNEREFRRCFQWATYLAKKRSKECFAPNTRRYGKSELPQEAYSTNWLEWFYTQFPQKA